MQPIIQTRALTRQFGTLTAVSDLTLEVYQGEVFGFLGHNGAGKTTTIRLLNGILAPTSGSATVLNLSPQNDGRALRQRTGVLTESPALDERLSGYANLSIYADLYSVPAADKASRIAHLLETFGLADRAGEKVGGYSKGMKQRLALARALIHNPEILFLDEPTAGLDPIVTRQVHDMIIRLSREEGRTIFLCTHNLAEAQRLCNRIGVMERGRLIALGKTDELAHEAGLTIGLEIEVTPDSLAAASELLRNQQPSLQVTADNHRLTVSGVRHEDIPTLVAALVHAGVGIYRVTPQEASLEDIYFALHAKEKAQ
ncbi:MAG TPA: ABC transporter ATP-binding protein [Spirillospora sp.]|nr:ABC transporter ATP-binding protein [Spirillospora sp.]